MLLLSDVVRKTVISSGQTNVPLDTFEYDSDLLSEIFENSLAEYEVYRPLRKKEILPLSPEGTPMPLALRILNVRPYVTNFTEFATPFDFRLWEYEEQTKKLTSTYNMTCSVEYLSKYTYDYLLVNQLKVNYITEHEETISFFMKDSFKKGTFNISLTNELDNITYSVNDDLSSYIPYESNFTVNTLSDVLTILEPVGKKLLTGSIIKLNNTGGALPTGLNSNDNYYVIKTSDISIKLASTLLNAQNNIAINLIDLGTGTHKIVSQVNLPLINLNGTLGSGTYNIENNKVTLNLSNSFRGALNLEFRTSNKGVFELNPDESLFLKLFKANFLISLGLFKSTLKTDNLPWDFSIDDLVGQGTKMKENLEEKELPDKSKWWLFR